ncbi:hypothetical protein AOL_s00004g408 [Orbilia oligospora ATCC 24927]|uniref:Nucleoside phosphorylase domain-containing protein n=1 Tax=Arthrobotrys oligospora (strain ATCC 24927 / CBS 115.81 / DSM 1491) TaxID=756982 RepID=G1WYP7_ARTOA|nr:hypothetical protein AOL_s00004g408 [Orbilia oligospora ATCC 24927]EGX53749.1 hypothetical protein AOL_s00004g408 [Orbilia oligospora ATCC 24927]
MDSPDESSAAVRPGRGRPPSQPLTVEDYDRIKEEILDLYHLDGKTMEEIVSILKEDELALNIPVAQLKHLLSSWGAGGRDQRRLTLHECEYVRYVRTKRHREGQPSRFFLDDVPLSERTIDWEINLQHLFMNKNFEEIEAPRRPKSIRVEPPSSLPDPQFVDGGQVSDTIFDNDTLMNLDDVDKTTNPIHNADYRASAPAKQTEVLGEYRILKFTDTLAYAKDRLSSQPNIYDKFLEILQLYQKDNGSIENVQDLQKELDQLFATDPDLQGDFKSFILSKVHRPRVVVGEARPQVEEVTATEELAGKWGFSDIKDEGISSLVDAPKVEHGSAMNGPPRNEGEVLHTEPPQATDSGYASMTHYDCGEPETTEPNVYECLSTSIVSLSIEDALDFDDTETVYSDTSSVATSTKQLYISELADALFREACPDQPCNEALERISRDLPDLLKAFALKIGCNAPSQMHRDVMFFVHKNRGDVVENFRQRWSYEVTENQIPVETPNDDNMALNEKMNIWFRSSESEYVPIPNQDLFDIQEEDEDEVEFENDDLNDHSTLAYREFIFKSPAFDWLVGSLRRDRFLIPTEPNSMEAIARHIIGSLPSSRKISKGRSAEAFKVTFTMDWKPLIFVEEQEYQDEPGEAIERAITITGTKKDAQALTCAEYLSQTWPATGKRILELVKDVIRGTFLDNAELTISLQRSSELAAEAFGTAHSIAEIGQQLAWLGTALRSSSCDIGVVACIPSISNIRTLVPQGSISYRLGFTVEEETIPLSNGQCWHSMFRNPVVVAGYPIPRRPTIGTGLELPLNMIAGLAKTKYIQPFNGGFFIKGFSTLLIPTKKEEPEGILIWHMIYNQDGDRIPYLENDIPIAEGLNISEIATARHILGWCSKAEYYAGAKEARYDIKGSRLPKPRGIHYALEKVYIQGRQIIKGGSPRPFALGKKDIAFHISRENPVKRLEWIDRKFFILWDEEDKRGWLVNGCGTLLHLLRTSLESNGDSTNKFHFKFHFEKGRMEEASLTHKIDSAVQFLLNDNNLQQEIYRTKDGNFRVEDRLDDLYDVLEKIIEHQIHITERVGSNDKEYLEGWDFNELATCEDPLYPRVSIFKKPSGGWIDFARTIRAVTLFGRGFGEIILPENTLCSQWATLPKEEYYLAAAVDDLQEIMKKEGDQYANPMRLADEIIWHTPRASFEKCKCQKKKYKLKGKHSDFVQAAIPAKLCNMLPNKDPVQLQKGGSAVIFGNSKKLNRVWEILLPRTDEESLPDLDFIRSTSSEEPPSSPSRDSGLGSSLNTIFTYTLSLTCRDYRVGIVCALPKELLAVRALFDQTHSRELLSSLEGDINQYALGQIYPHNVVAACLPSGEYGTNAAAIICSHMRRSFPKLKICLLVGIGGGVPSSGLRLGDVVVSQQAKGFPAVTQYDLGKFLHDGVFEITGYLQRPPQFIMIAISNLASDPELPCRPLETYLQDIAKKHPEYGYPNHEDPLLTPTCSHDRDSRTGIQCGCPVIQSHPRPGNPRIHYGPIGSGNILLKNAEKRDELAANRGFLCFEMEAAGAMNTGDFLVIRGISDYCDASKNDTWQEYAAATAAAYAKLLLSKTTIPKDADALVPGPATTHPRKRVPTPESVNSDSNPTKKVRRKKELINGDTHI